MNRDSEGSASLHDIDISGELHSRPAMRVNRRAEIRAIYSLATAVTEHLDATLKRLAFFAVELCGVGSGGVSVLESTEAGPIFRWRAIAGEMEHFQGGGLPQQWSPCGECLKLGQAVLYLQPARHFTYFEGLRPPIEEGLVIPISSGSDCLPPATIWVVSHSAACRLNAEHVRIMRSLGEFADRALRRTLDTPATLCPVDDSQEIVWREYLWRIALGDESALEILFEETRPLVFSAALRILGFQADAEEITTDVFSRVWVAARKYDVKRGSVCTWLTAIVRNAALDRLRSRSAHDRNLSALLSECSSGDDPESSLLRSERVNILTCALQELPAAQRQAVELNFFSAKPAAVIAAELGCPIGTVKTRLRLALLHLRQLMAALEKSPQKRTSSEICLVENRSYHDSMSRSASLRESTLTVAPLRRV